MSTHYLINVFANPLSSAEIIDVITPTSGISRPQGGHVIRIPDEVSVQDPTGLNDLLSKKYTGLLAAYAGFGRCVYDDLLDDLGIDLASVPAANRKARLGSRGNISLDASSRLQTVMVSLTATPSQAYVIFELYRWGYNDTSTAVLERFYSEVAHDPTEIVAEVSFDNGVHWYSCLDGVALNIPPIGQGSQLILRWTATSIAPRTWLGSWAVIY